MNEREEIRFIDLYSGVGGFRRGLERANEERRILRRQDMHGHRTDVDECGRKAPVGHISQEPPRGSEIGLERANYLGEAQLEQDKGSRSDSADAYGKSSALRGSKSSPRRFRCVWSCDNNRYANQIYVKQFGETNHYSGDIRGVDPGDIPDFDLLCAGFPCQSFSVAGPRTGFQDTRGTLFFEISRIAEAKRPQMLLLENVKGLLSNDRGQTFQTILQELGRIGYWTEWQILNSKHHGVPQNRERVFIIGHLRGAGGREIFPIAETSEVANIRTSEEQIASCLQSPGHAHGNYKGMNMIKVGNIAESGHDSLWGRVYDPEGIAMNLNAEGGGVGAKTGLYAILSDNLGGNIKNRVRDADEAPAWTLGGSSTKVAISFTNPHNAEEERKINISDTSRAVKPPYGNQQPLILTPDSYNIKDSNADAEEADTREILRLLWEAIGEKTPQERRFRELIALQQKEILRQRMYGEGVQGEMEGRSSSTSRQLQSKTVNFSVQMQDLWKNIKPRYSPQRREQVEQLLGQLAGSMSGMPPEGSLARQREERGDAQEAEEGFSRSFRIRRLTPCECERLQGFPDGWTAHGLCEKGDIVWTGKYKVRVEIDEDGLEVTRYRPIMTKAKSDGIYPISDTQRYRALGNAVTTRVITFLGRRIMEAWP